MNPFNIKITDAKNTESTIATPELFKTDNVDLQSIHAQLLKTALTDKETLQTNTPNDLAMPPNDTAPNMHSQIMILPNFLSEDICDEYIEYIEKNKEIDLSVFDAESTNKTGEISWEIDKKTRDTQTVDIEPIKSVIIELMKYAVRDFINPFYNVQIQSSELPQILVYHPGGHYKPHIDGETLFNDGSGTLQWKKNVKRDISLIVYLNDDFEGGELVFPKQAIKIKPRKGLMLAFPSTHHFLHGVNPVLTGTRYAIVDWFSIKE